MSASPLSTVADWHAYLSRYGAEFRESAYLRELLDDGLWHRDRFTDEQWAGGWFGRDPAAEEAVAAAEQRLGARLPPSYRTFLRTSDGWPTMSYAVDLVGVDEIGWFGDVEPDLVEAWSEVPDLAEEFGSLRRSLLISFDDGGAGRYLFLRPDDGPDDTPGAPSDAAEWPAYDWWPGDGSLPERHADFATLLADLWADETAYRGGTTGS